MLKVNGQEVAFEPASLLQLVERQGYDARTVAAELNGEIVGREKWATEEIADGDVLEIISFMGGG